MAAIPPIGSCRAQRLPLQAVSRTLEAQRRATSPITIDGDLADWPVARSFVLDASTAQYVGGSIGSRARRQPGDLQPCGMIPTCTWPRSVTDNTLVADSSNVWDDDSLEIALDGGRDGRCCSADDHQYTIAVDGRLADFGVIQQTSVSGVAAGCGACSRTGYRVEMAIPLTKLSGRPVVAGRSHGPQPGAERR